MTTPEITPRITSWWAIRREALAQLGQAEFDRRMAIIRKQARRVADDPAWFREDTDREQVFVFMAWRLQALAVRLNPDNFAQLEQFDADTVGALVVSALEDGILI